MALEQGCFRRTVCQLLRSGGEPSSPSSASIGAYALLRNARARQPDYSDAGLGAARRPALLKNP
jgi:hypothetical protein